MLLEARCGHISSPRELVLSDSPLAQAYTLHSYGWGTGICVFNMQGISDMLCILVCELLFQVLTNGGIEGSKKSRLGRNFWTWSFF